MFGHESHRQPWGCTYPAWVRQWLLPYGCVLPAVGAAALLQYVLEKSFADIQPYAIFYAAIMLATIVGGLWPGIEATLLSVASIDYFFISPGQLGHWRSGEAAAMAVFTSVGLVSPLLADIALRWKYGTRKGTDKAAEDALRVSEQRYRSVVTAMAEGVVVQDASGVILACNPRAEEILGLTAAQMQGLTSVDTRWRAIHEDGSPFPGETHPAMITLRTGEPQKDVCMGVMKPGGILSWILINAQPIFHSGTQSPDAVVTTFTDITERRHIEEAVRESEERFRVALQSSPSVVFNQDRDLRYTWINSPVAAWAEKGWLGKTDAEIVEDPENVARLTAVKLRILRTGKGVREEIPVSFQGRTMYYDFTGEPLHDCAGNLVGITCAALDITERKQAEEQLRLASLHARSLIEASLDPLVTINRAGKITDVNRATERVTGFPREHLIGSDFCSYFTEPEKAREGYRQVFETESVRDYPLAIRGASGQITHVLYNASVFRNEAGEVQGVFAAARDVTERRLLEEQLSQAQKLEAVGRLAGGVAHDFNNIMSIIIGYAELLQKKVGSADPSSKPVDNILKAAGRAAALTRQLLAFSRKQVMDIRVLDLNEQIVELSKMLPRLIGESVEIVLDLATDLRPVRADPTQFEQVLLNLAVNARDAMPDGGTLTIASANVNLEMAYCRLHPGVVPGPYVDISVSDTGIGMDEETRSHIFEPFFTTKGAGRGTGLGLSIIYGIVRQSGGHIWVYSEPGRGTRFKIYLPSVEGVATKLAPESHQPVVVVPEVSPATILVVEDEIALAEMTRSVLQDCGYTVLLAGNGEEALKLAHGYTAAIDLLVTDVILSAGINGIELAKELRLLRPETKVLYMSGYSDALVKARADVESGGVLLEKPFTTDLLRTTVRRVLRRAIGAAG